MRFKLLVSHILQFQVELRDSFHSWRRRQKASQELVLETHSIVQVCDGCQKIWELVLDVYGRCPEMYSQDGLLYQANDLTWAEIREMNESAGLSSVLETLSDPSILLDQSLIL